MLFYPYTHITRGLRLLCLWLSILGGVDVHFTQEPSDPSYFNNGGDANLVWDYTDPHNYIQSIIYSVLVNGAFVKMMVNDSRGVQEHPKIPSLYKGRVKIDGRATLVIKNINPGDSTKFRCDLFGKFVYFIQSTVQLIVTGTYFRHNSCLLHFWESKKWHKFAQTFIGRAESGLVTWLLGAIVLLLLGMQRSTKGENKFHRLLCCYSHQ